MVAQAPQFLASERIYLNSSRYFSVAAATTWREGIKVARANTGMVQTVAMTVGMEDHTTGKEAGIAMQFLW